MPTLGLKTSKIVYHVFDEHGPLNLAIYRELAIWTDEVTVLLQHRLLTDWNNHSIITVTMAVSSIAILLMCADSDLNEEWFLERI